MEDTSNFNIVVYHLTKDNTENIYNKLRLMGITAHPYGTKEYKKIGFSLSRNRQEFIIGEGDFVAINTDVANLQPIPILNQYFTESVLILLSQFGQLTIKE